MTVRHWTRAQALGPVSPLDLDELDDVDVLVIDDVDDHDDDRLAWCHLAPCVVAAVGADGAGPAVADVIVTTNELDRLIAVVGANPQASRVLVDVLRTVDGIPVVDGVVVESLAYSLLLGGAEFAGWLAQASRPRPRRFDRPPIRLRRDDDELRITLDRPENRNAHSAEMRDALCDALDMAAADPSIREVMVDAAGPVFSSGGDLVEFGTATDLVRAHDVRGLRSVGRRLALLDAHTVVRVQGACVGAGVEIPAFADEVHAAPGATFRLPEIAMGLIPGAGGTVSLTARIGRQRTARLALLGDSLSAEEAMDWGLVDRVE